MNYTEFSIKTVKRAGDILLGERDKRFWVATKNNDHKNIVTSVDIKVDDFIKGEISKNFPDHCIYSEESGEEGSDKYQWTIDPIDGTSNFARAIPHYSICLGIMRNQIPIAGAIFNPMTNELFSFKKDKGAYLNGEKIKVSPETDLRNSYVLLHAGRTEEVRDWGGESYKQLLKHAKKTGNLSCSSLDACFVAAGRVEANIYGTLSLHDISPAVGIIKEAGGVVKNFENSDLQILCNTQKIIMANNEEILAEILNLIG